MFILIARYKVKESNQKQFLVESNEYYSKKFKKARGFKSVEFLRNIIDKEYMDVMTKWETKEDFLSFIKKHHKEGAMKFSVPVEILERFMYEELK